MTCRRIEQDCKRSTERRQRGFDLTDFSANHWAPKTFYALGSVIRVTGELAGGEQSFTGYEYVADADGFTGEFEPAWPDVGSVDDGSTSWTRVDVSNDSLLREILTVLWVAPTGMVVDDDEIVNSEGRQQISAFHSGGTNGQKLLVIARVTFDDGSIEDFGLRWTIKD